MGMWIEESETETRSVEELKQNMLSMHQKLSEYEALPKQEELEVTKTQEELNKELEVYEDEDYSCEIEEEPEVNNPSTIDISAIANMAESADLGDDEYPEDDEEYIEDDEEYIEDDDLDDSDYIGDEEDTEDTEDDLSEEEEAPEVIKNEPKVKVKADVKTETDSELELLREKVRLAELAELKAKIRLAELEKEKADKKIAELENKSVKEKVGVKHTDKTLIKEEKPIVKEEMQSKVVCVSAVNYDALNTKELFGCLLAYIQQKGIDTKKPLNADELVAEFKLDNIKRLVKNNYVFNTSRGLVLGKIK